MDAQIKTHEATLLVDAEKRGLASYHPNWDAYRGAYAQVLAAVARGDATGAKRVYFAKAAPLYAAVDDDLAGLAKVNQQPERAGSDRARRAVRDLQRDARARLL